METDFASLGVLQKRVWSSLVAIQGRDDSFWLSNGFVGDGMEDSNKPVHRVTELTKTERGLEAVLPMVADPSINSAVVNDNQLEGNEVILDADAQTIRVDLIRYGIRSKGQMSELATVLRFRTLAKERLGFTLADVYDELLFLTGSGRAYTLNTDGSTRPASQLPQLSFAADVTPASTNRIMYAGSATSEATLTASDTMSWNLIVQAKAFAKRKRIRPLRAGGRSFYLMVMSTEQMRDLEQSSDYKSLQAQAMPRGIDNPLFTNAKKIVSDIVLYDHQKAFNTLGLSSGSRWGAGGTVHGAQALLMGAQALGIAFLDSGPQWSESDNTDYKNRQGIGVGRIMGCLKPQYKSKYDANSREDCSVVSVKTAAAQN